jgi:hypothetical protein
VVTIVFVAIAALVLVHVVFLTWRLRRPALRVYRAGRNSARIEAMKKAAAENAATVRENAKYVSPDAPGNYQDEL